MSTVIYVLTSLLNIELLQYPEIAEQVNHIFVNLLNSIRHVDPTCPIACANSIDTMPSVLLSNPELVILDKIEQYATPDQLFDLFCQAPDSTCFLVFVRSNISLPVTLYSYARLNWELSGTRRVTLQYLLERDVNCDSYIDNRCTVRLLLCSYGREVS